MKLNGKNIIFDDDVTMTGKNIGEKLSEVIGELQSDSAKMKSYLKWIYNYGGVGGSGGGGGSSDSNYLLYAELGEQQMKGQTISLGGSGNYPLRISIQRPEGATYTVSYKIIDKENGNSVIEKSNPIRLDLENNYSCERVLKLDTNATLIVESTDSIYNVKKTITADFITRSYIIKSSFVNEDRDLLGEEITISDVLQKKLFARINYNVAVEYESIDYVLKINLKDKKLIINKDTNSDCYIEIGNKKKSGEVLLDLVDIIGKITAREGDKWTPTRENAGYYSYELIINLIMKNQTPDPVISNVKFNLIPEDLYLLVTPEKGDIYSITQKENSKYEYNPGYIIFNLKPYMGSFTEDMCNISYYLNEDKDSVNEVPTKLRDQVSVQVYSIREGENFINFRLSCGGSYYPSKDVYVKYYFYISKSESDLFWYNLNKKERKGFFNYFRGGKDDGFSEFGDGEFQNKNLKHFRETIDHQYLRQSVNREAPLVNVVKISNAGDGSSGSYVIAKEGQPGYNDLILPPENEMDNYSVMLHVGLQFSEINNKNSVILSAYTINSSGGLSEYLRLYQDKVIVNGKEISYYFPKIKDDFGSSINNSHLLSIVFRRMYRISSDTYYEFTLYIDGILESSSLTYITALPRISGIIFGKSNYFVDLLELSYLNPLVKSYLDEKNNEISNSEDLSIYQYYLKYKSYRIDRDNQEEILKLNDNKKILKLGLNIDVLNNGEVICDESTVSNIANSISLPTMMMVIQDNEGKRKTYIDSRYNEDEGNEVIDTAIYWSKGNASGQGNSGMLSKVSFPDGYSALFRIKIQGSSTKSYKCKNFNLELVNRLGSDNESDYYLYSPNFDPTDNSTFLPEQMFTLKADVVDSSHSNNTSIGSFVNDITSKFNTGSGSVNPLLEGYIKNCLEGFPFLMFIEYVKTVDGIDKKTCYYQGVYNFNLGRESYYNLGYSDYKIFCDSSGNSVLKSSENGFVFHKTAKSNIKLKEGLIVTEIQGNNNMFDFSQYDQSILFFNNVVGDNTYMFGDFVRGSNVSPGDANNLVSELVKRISKAGGYCFDKLKKSYSNSLEDNFGYDEGYNAVKQIKIGTTEKGENIYKDVSKNQVPNYRYQFEKKDTGLGEFNFVPKNPEEPLKSADKFDLNSLILNVDDNDERIIPWLDYKSLSEYYTICMAFGLVDSVQKNMNLKTWNANPRNNSATFYTAFYDMDTCLGVNNSGKPVSYFAFSDYWDYSENDSSTVVKPSPVTIYRDFSPKKGSTSVNADDFYDTPSSYIFAIAKYARKIYNTSSNMGDICEKTEVADWPKQLWVKWRNPNSMDDDKTAGCLSTSDKFINNYFSNTLGKLPPLLVTLNYRNKYLVKLSNSDEQSKHGFNEVNFEKFGGTRIYKVADWLSSRFHILDAYFNVTNSISNYEYYDENGNYTSEMGLQEPSVSESETLKNNSDVIVFQDIFAGGQVNQSAGTLDIRVRAHEFSPLFITIANNSKRYLLGGDKEYNIVTKLSGNQTYTFGGSGAWTELDSVNTFNFSSLNVNSKYLETLVSNNDNNTTIGNIIMPSLRKVDLSGSNLKGKLVFDGQKNFTNLERINISNSYLDLNLSKSECREINISNLKKSNISIIDCQNISSLTFGKGYLGNPSTSIEKCEINPIPRYLVNDFKLEYSSIRDLTLHNPYKTNNSKLTIIGDNTLVKLDLKGFKEIRLKDCKNLSTVYLTDPDVKNKGDNLVKLEIINCGFYAGNLTIGSVNTPVGQADLKSFKELTYLQISNCETIERICLQENVNHNIYLDEGAFKDNKKLKYISGKGLIIRGNSVFQNCHAFTLKQGPEPDSGQLSLTLGNNPKTGEPLTDISNLFNGGNGGGSINLEAAKTFIETTGNIEKVTNISGLFSSQKIRYNKDDLLEDMKSGDHITLRMDKLTKVTNANSFLSWNGGITALNKHMLSFGSEAKGPVTANSFVFYYTHGTTDSKDSWFTAPMDLLTLIIDKLSGTFGWSGNDYDYFRLRLVKLDDTRSNLITIGSENRYKPLVLKDFFHPTIGGKIHHPHISHLEKIAFYDNYYEDNKNDLVDSNGNLKHSGKNNLYINLTGVFDNWESLETINGFLYDKEYTNVDLSSLDGLLFNLKKFKYIQDSLNINNKSNPINLYKFIDWEYLGENKIMKDKDPFKNSSFNNEKGSFFLYKYVSEGDMGEIWYSLRNSECQGASNVFRNCTLVTKNEPSISPGKMSNTSIEYLNFTYKDFKVKHYTDNQALTEELIKSIAKDSSKPDTYFYIDPEFFTKTLQGVISLESTFENTKITTRNLENQTAIPTNFFGKRFKKISSVKYANPKDLEKFTPIDGIYVRTIDGEYTEDGKLIENTFIDAHECVYLYKKVIHNLKNIFKNTKWYSDRTKINARSYVPTIENGKIKYDDSNYLEYGSGGERIYDEGTEYYIETTKRHVITDPITGEEKEVKLIGYTVSGRISLNPEIKDLKNILESEEPLGGYESSMIVSDKKGIEYKFNNYRLNESSIRRSFFIAPDFFYGCTDNCIISGAFDNSTNSNECLEGMIPPNLFLGHKNLEVYNTFRNLNIIPRYIQSEVEEYSDSTDPSITKTKTNNIYSYIPSDFLNQTNLSYAFNFHFLAPPAEKYTGKGVEFDTYYYLLGDSINKYSTSLNNSLPSVYYKELDSQGNQIDGLFQKGGTSGEGDGYPDSHKNDFKMHINIMHTIMNLNNPDGTITYKGEDGLDLSKFNRLKLDNLVPSALSFFLYGNLIRSNSFLLDDIAWENPKNFIIHAFNLSNNIDDLGRYCISRNCNLPGASKNARLADKYLINFYSLYLYESQIYPFSEPYTQITGYPSNPGGHPHIRVVTEGSEE